MGRWVVQGAKDWDEGMGKAQMGGAKETELYSV